MGDDETIGDLEDEELGVSVEDSLEPLKFAHIAPQKKREPKISIGQAVQKYGKRDSKHIIEQEKTKAFLANREIIRRLMHDPAQFKTGELNFTSGTAVDKIAKKERWDKAGDEGGKTWTEQFVDAIGRLQGEGGMKLTLEVTSAHANRIEAHVLPAIDVPVIQEGEDVRSLPEHG